MSALGPALLHVKVGRKGTHSCKRTFGFLVTFKPAVLVINTIQFPKTTKRKFGSTNTKYTINSKTNNEEEKHKLNKCETPPYQNYQNQ